MKTLSVTLLFVLLTGFSYAQQTYVPDDNFENYLETHDADGNTVTIGDASSMGNGIANDNYVLTSRINTVHQLHVQGLSITDLTGIEDFQNLYTLYCQDNDLTTINISQNTHIVRFKCSFNQLTDLDVTQNVHLQSFSCMNNQLTSLDVSQNPDLMRFWCDNNQLTSLDVSNNLDLEWFTFSYNQLTDIDVSHNTHLELLACQHNQLTSLNVSHLNNLEWLECFSNQLTELRMKIGNSPNLTTFDATYNPNLICVFVDSAWFMNINWPAAIDDTATYVETQAECDALEITEAFKETIEVYPNPINEYLNIQAPNEVSIKSISIQNMQGQVIYKSNFAPQIKLSNLQTGMYFLSIENKTGDKAVFKLIKN